LTVLERNPRRGTALDKVYGFHIENGSIEAFCQELRQRVEQKPDDGAGWMILGLVESQRGRDAAAVEALTKAQELRPTDALAAYYLGQSLVLVGQPDKAVTAFEEAITRKPAPTDRAPAAGLPLEKPLKATGTVDFRLVVKDGVMTMLVNDQEVLTERLPVQIFIVVLYVFAALTACSYFLTVVVVGLGWPVEQPSRSAARELWV
jgi:tetratricopeptide (TPR) repeat protein